MTPKHPAAHDAQAKAAAELYAMADAMHSRALGHSTDAMRSAEAGDWQAADAALAAARAAQAAADALADEAEQA